MLEGSTQGKMGVGTTQGKTNYPLRESYATHVCRKTKRGPLAREHIELPLPKLLQLVPGGLTGGRSTYPKGIIDSCATSRT